MKVKIVAKPDPSVPFGSINAGSLFAFGADIYICTNTRVGVNLSTGDVAPFRPADRVLIFDHEPLVCTFR